MAERQFGPYRLVRQIAVGGMAEIHLAKTAGIAGFEKYVALKMIHPNFAEDDQFIQMLVDEAKIAVQLTHGNIAQTFDLGRVGDTYYITMEYVDGADLYKILRRASEQDLEMPLDVCAFVGKEISSALDHAHRKRDHAGKSLGIVHRDVSPQNVLVSHSGEVKLVDFGIAKATMKARQTAAGVIKGKYYYMSPEQAWGDPIDHRSDIFSAGIVLYEMITGQMLYLEEDLHKLLEMARSADIAPPSKLRRGVPPQLERIVMHALEKVPGERYQNAGDFATDLERFLHAYSPVFTASKLSSLLRQVLGDPMHVPDDPAFDSIEFRDGVMSTQPLDDAEVAHAIDRAELRDENSVIFRVSELERPRPKEDRPTTPRPATPPPVPSPPPARTVTPRPAAASQVAPRVTRAADPMPLPASRPVVTARLPSIAPARPSLPAKPAQPPRPREPHEETRRLDSPAPANPLHDDSGLLITERPAGFDGKNAAWEDTDRSETADEDFESIADRTVITAVPGMSGFMVDDGDGPIEATLVTSAPTGLGFGEDDATSEAITERLDEVAPRPRDSALDHPTKPARAAANASATAALSANIHAPAVSELRKPRASRRTPPGGSPLSSVSPVSPVSPRPQPNVLHAIVASKASEPMPAPRPPTLRSPPPAPLAPTQAMGVQDLPPPIDPFAPQFPMGTPGGQAPYNNDASGLPLGIPTPPGLPLQPGSAGPEGAPPYPPPYMQMPGMGPGYAQQGLATQMSPQGYPQMSPGGLYHFQPPPQQMSLTGQMRLLDVDELPAQFKLGAARLRWFTYIVSGLLAVSVAAAVTFLIIRSTREATPNFGSIHVESVPVGAAVYYDGTQLLDKTPLVIDGVVVGTRHAIRVELGHHKPYQEIADIPRNGGQVSVMAYLKPVTGKLVINSVPANAEIHINGQLRGRTPKTLTDIDMESAKRLELRLKDYQLFVQELRWPPDGRIDIDAKLVR